MKIDVNTPKEYITQLPEDRQEVIRKLRKTILNHLPKGFEETINYGMIGYVVPHSIYPNGYHTDPTLPLPFINIASQKNYVALYHMGIYSDPELLSWFQKEYANVCSTKLDMGKSCIRFKNINDIPFIGKLCEKINPEKWIKIYESHVTR